MVRAVAPRSIIWASLATLVAVGLAGATATAAPTSTGGLDLTVSVENPLAPSLRLTNHSGEACRVAGQAFGAVTFTRVEQAGVPISPVYLDAGLPDSLDALVLAKLRALDRGASVDFPVRVVPFGPDGKGHALAALTWSAALGGTEVLYPVQAQGPLRLDVAYAVPRAASVCGPAVGTSAAGAPGGRAGISHRLLWMLLAGGVLLALAVVVVIFLLQRRGRRRRVAGATALVLLSSLGLLGLDAAAGRPAFARIEASSAVIDDWIVCSNIFHSPGGDPANILPALENPNILIQIDQGYHDAEAKWSDRIHIDWDNTATGHYQYADSPPDSPVYAEPCTTLYHELYHAYEDIVFGGHNTNPCGLLDGKRYPSVTEVLATQAENRLREHLHLPKRTAYGGLPLPPDGAPCVPFTQDLPSLQDRCWNLPSAAPLNPRPAIGQAAPIRAAPLRAAVAPAAGAPCGDSRGDPHLRTFDGRFYDFQAVGEFIAARDPAGGFEVQLRQQPLAGSRVVSLNTAVAMAVGTDRVQLRLAGRDLEFRVDGAIRPLTTSLLPGGGKVTVTPTAGGPEVTVTWPDGSLVGVAPPYTWALQVVLAPANARAGRLEGLLGDADGDPTNDIRARGGAPITALSYAALYPNLADSWRVSAQTSLFSYEAGTSTETYTDRSFPDRYATVADVPGRAGAEALCRRAGVSDPDLLRDCTLDVGLTGQPDFAATARLAQGLFGGFRLGGPAVALTIQAGGTARVAFAGTAGTRVRIEAVAPVRTAQCVGLALRGPDEKTLTTSCLRDGAGQLDSAPLPTSGSYTVVVDPGTSGVGTVLVRIVAVADVTGEIVPDGPIATATIAAPGAVARLGFNGTQGQKVFVDIVSSTLPDSCWPVSLRAPDDSSIQIGCVIGGTGYLDGIVLPSTGRYAVVVDPSGPETGATALRLTVAIDQQLAITSGGPEAVSTIGQPGAESRLTFAGTAGQKVFLDVPSSGLPDGCGVLELREPGGHAIAAGCVISGKGFIDGTVLPANGVYTIVVNPAARGTGVSHLRLLPVTDQQLAIVRNGPEVTATIGAPGGVSRLTFTGSAGTTVSLEVVSATISDACGVLRLAAPNGDVFASGCVIGGKGGITGATLPATGQYTIIVDPLERITGEVRLRLH